VIVAGLMSGTSMDGLDVAVADLSWDDDVVVLRPLGHRERPWPDELRRRLRALLSPAPTSAQELTELDTLVGQASGTAAAAALAELAPAGGDLVASHGQTIFHWVVDGRARGTLQIGQPAWIVEATGLPTVSDLRARDVAAGGHGAPLASTLDVLWLAGPGGPRAALNLGGIANVTVVGDEAALASFDTGPGNCLLDDAAARVTGGALDHDRDGRLASGGRVREELLARLLADEYYAAPPPKSTGRERFHGSYVVERLDGPPPPPEDLLATLTELTAATVAGALAPFAVTEVVASGGGVRNPALVAALRRRLGRTPLITSDERGLDPGAKEAYLMALLGFLTWHGVPGVAPGVTGTAVPRVLGRISPGDAPLRLPPPRAWPAALRVPARIAGTS
jgi:anhydro-N-acetylmuramic acid kinase